MDDNLSNYYIMPSSRSFLSLFRRRNKTEKPNRKSIWNIFTRKKKYKPSDKPAKNVSQHDPQPAKTKSQLEKDIVDVNKIQVVDISPAKTHIESNISMKQAVIDSLDIFDSPAVDEKSLNKSYISNLNMVISSFVFTKYNIKSYMESLKAANASNKLNLDNICLLNRDDMFNAMFMEKNANNVGSRYVSQKNKSITSSVKSNLIALILELSDDFCSDSIGITYLENTFINTFNIKNMATNNYDILFICDKKIKDKNLSFKERIPYIQAFISIELGECKKYSRAYAIRVFCSRSSSKSAGYGSILLGCLLYSLHIKYQNADRHSIDNYNSNMSNLVINGVKVRHDEAQKPIADILYGSVEGPYIYPAIVLEALDGYINPSAICTYEKFGFQFEDDLIDINCFQDSRNIPMIFDKGFLYHNNKLVSNKETMDKHYKGIREKIVNIVVGKDAGYEKEDICKIKGKHQLLLGYLINLLHKLSYANKYPNTKSEINDIDQELYSIMQDMKNKPKLLVVDIEDIVNEIGDYIKSDIVKSPDRILDDYISKMVDAIGYSSPVKSESPKKSVSTKNMSTKKSVSPKKSVSHKIMSTKKSVSPKNPALLSRSISNRKSPVVKLSHKMRSSSFNRSRSSK